MLTVAERANEARRLLHAHLHPWAYSLEEIAVMSDEDVILTAIASDLMEDED